MLVKNTFCYFRLALFYRNGLLHKYRHSHSYVSVKQALETVPSRSIPVLIQVGGLADLDLVVNTCIL